jgi:tetratricopeptide (TPR) repeat protein
VDDGSEHRAAFYDGGREVDTARVRVHPLLRQYAAVLWRVQGADDRAASLSALLAALAAFAEEHRRDFAALSREEALLVGAVRAAAREGAAHDALIALVRELRGYMYDGGRWRLGAELFAAQLVARRTIGDRVGEGATLNNLGLLASAMGEREGAQRYFEEALAIRRAVGDRAGEGTILNNLGALCSITRDLPAARRYYEEALTLLRAVGDRAGEGTILNNLGLLCRSLNDVVTARRYYEEALTLFEALDAAADASAVRNNLLVLAQDQVKAASSAQIGDVLADERG